MESIGFSNKTELQDFSQIKEKVLEALKDHFRPEFINRLDEIIVFDILSEIAIREIVNLRVQVVKDRLTAKGIDFKLMKMRWPIWQRKVTNSTTEQDHLIV